MKILYKFFYIIFIYYNMNSYYLFFYDIMKKDMFLYIIYKYITF